MVIRGDLVSVPSLYPGRVGTASHSDDSGRWVVWRDTGGHWSASSYRPKLVVFVAHAPAGQPRLELGG